MNHHFKPRFPLSKPFIPGGHPQESRKAPVHFMPKLADGGVLDPRRWPPAGIIDPQQFQTHPEIPTPPDMPTPDGRVPYMVNGAEGVQWPQEQMSPPSPTFPHLPPPQMQLPPGSQQQPIPSGPVDMPTPPPVAPPSQEQAMYPGGMEPPRQDIPTPSSPAMQGTPPAGLIGPLQEKYRKDAEAFQNMKVPGWRTAIAAALSVSPHLQGVSRAVGGGVARERAKQNLGVSARLADEEQQVRREAAMEDDRRQQRALTAENIGAMRDARQAQVEAARQRTKQDAIKNGWYALGAGEQVPAGMQRLTVNGEQGYVDKARRIREDTEAKNIYTLPPSLQALGFPPKVDEAMMKVAITVAETNGRAKDAADMRQQMAELAESGRNERAKEHNDLMRELKRTGNGENTASLVDEIIKNPAIYDNLTPTMKTKISAELSKRGFENFGKPLAESAIGKLSDMKSAISGLKDLRDTLKENEQYIGPISGLAAMNPYSEARKAQAKIDLVKQRVGKTLEGGVLRKEDEEKYKRILATLNDTPSTAIYKVEQVMAAIERDLEIFQNEQKGAGRRGMGGNATPKAAPTQGSGNMPFKPGDTAPNGKKIKSIVEIKP